MSDPSSGDPSTTPPAPQYGVPAPAYGQPGAAPYPTPGLQAYGSPTPPPYGAPQQPYGQAPSYGQAPAYAQAPAYGYGYGTAPRTNTLAIVSLIASISAFVILPIIGSIVGIITGHLSLGQLKTSGESGRGIALAGTIIGWVSIGLGILLLLLVFAVWVPLATSVRYA